MKQEDGMYLDCVTPPSLAEAFENIKRERGLRSGQAGNLKGEVAEQRCWQAASELCSRHAWLFSARRSTRREDARGIDMVVESDIGRLYIQVKSARFGAWRFRQKRQRCKAIVVIIPPEMDDDKVQNKVYDALCRLRRYFKKKRQRHNCGPAS